MRYPPLLIALFLAMLLRPFASDASGVAGGLFLAIVFSTVIYAFRHIPRLAAAVSVLGVVAVIGRIVGNDAHSVTAELLSHGVSLVVMVLAMIEMLSEVLRARTATTDMVIGAVCLYLVIGLAWTFLYYSIYLLRPGAMFVSPGTAPFSALSDEAKFTEVMYFSFAALTTIGSSGEEALTTMARQLAVVEAAMGQLYLAVLISRLVGFSTAGNPERS